jgi:hypothetical protein
VTSPVVGMAHYLNTNAETEGIETYNHAGQWRKPWNMPWGILGYGSATSDQNIAASVPTTITGSALTATVAANRVLRYSWFARFTCTSGTLSIDVQPTRDGTQLGSNYLQLVTTNNFYFASGFYIDTAATGASHTWSLVVPAPGANTSYVSAGATWPSWFALEDIGPKTGGTVT